MSVYDIIQTDIEKTIANLMNQNLIINPTFTTKNCKFDKISSKMIESKMDKTKTYVTNFLRFYNNGEYLFLLNDHSMVQINYIFKQDPGSRKQYVTKANLNYYPNPGLYDSELLDALTSDIDLNEQVELWYELVQDVEKDFTYRSNYIRLDFSDADKDFTELTHPRCHIHIGLNDNFRIAINKLPLLSDFMDLVLFSSYIDDWKKIRSDDLADLTRFKSLMLSKESNYPMLTKFNSVVTELEEMHYLFKI
ncbi:DUF2290 domain-containing protein [Psychrobacillus glaciei]|uniref:DUF2290 domain-containing protein n=1 Tax=Psychrobacillus glaciei TaxID=2283160 RepID=A0A5J6SS29_9BACI|nr:DUF2290 domain-containing protein [Psychrobacillus glaciei]QFG00797.1 DUF2290 domain-containing protein [Psychrobacillus glaciei]